MLLATSPCIIFNLFFIWGMTWSKGTNMLRLLVHVAGLIANQEWTVGCTVSPLLIWLDLYGSCRWNSSENVMWHPPASQAERLTRCRSAVGSEPGFCELSTLLRTICCEHASPLCWRHRQTAAWPGQAGRLQPGRGGGTCDYLAPFCLDNWYSKRRKQCNGTFSRSEWVCCGLS